ncbi:hypothetical protein [Rhizobium sp. LC145]|uniref:hypothetical protein n=1 Tax=Rhizobium sp. LC145 TaxID=1120688 RepID=UPI00062A315B|nr:hypothetical protein [Rhizobium sp. LC145]KKX30366.1 hypothetical protein YH62_12530 [Rhizobium sp. LC145]TKT56756.1 hypothetical protein FDR95_14825 [Rhizobiaceae bacterium LC148]
MIVAITGSRQETEERHGIMERKANDDRENNRFEQKDRQRVDDELHAQTDMTKHEAQKEASELGGGDTYLVETDLDERDQREDEDQPDGRASPMANTDNPKD